MSNTIVGFLFIFKNQANPSEYTEMAWEGLLGAVNAARDSKQQVVESEHLMKALLEQKDGLARRIFTKAGLDNTSVLQATDDFISKQPKVAALHFFVQFWCFLFYNSIVTSGDLNLG